MTEIALIGDLHAASHPRFGGARQNGINARGRLVLESLNRALRSFSGSGREPDAIVFLGDVFEGPRPDPPLIAALGLTLPTLPRVYLLTGNHDVSSTAHGDHALGPLALCENVSSIDAPARHIVGRGDSAVELLLAPWHPTPLLPYLDTFLARYPTRGQPRVLCLHAGLHGDTTSPGDGAHDAPDAVHVSRLIDLCRAHGIAQVFAGHWHRPRAWHLDGVEVVQAGAFCPASFADSGVDYGAVYTTNGYDVTSARVAVPRFEIVHSPDELAAATASAEQGVNCTVLYVRWLARSGELAAAYRECAAAQTHGQLADFEVWPDTQEAGVIAHEAAERAADAGSLDTAVRAYVRAMPLDAALNRVAIEHDVLRRLKLR